MLFETVGIVEDKMRTFTDKQWSEFWAQVASGKITQATLQWLLENSGKISDQPMPAPNLDGLSETFEVKVGEDHTQKHYLLLNIKF